LLEYERQIANLIAFKAFYFLPFNNYNFKIMELETDFGKFEFVSIETPFKSLDS